MTALHLIGRYSIMHTVGGTWATYRAQLCQLPGQLGAAPEMHAFMQRAAALAGVCNAPSWPLNRSRHMCPCCSPLMLCMPHLAWHCRPSLQSLPAAQLMLNIVMHPRILQQRALHTPMRSAQSSLPSGPRLNPLLLYTLKSYLTELTQQPIRG